MGRNLQPFPYKLFVHSRGEVIRRPPADTTLVWYAIVIFKKNSFLFESSALIGSASHQIYLIEKLGYNVIRVRYL